MLKLPYKYYEKLKQKKYRRTEKKFLIEGENLLSECAASEKFRNSFEAVFYRKDHAGSELISKIESLNPGARIEITEENIISRLSDTVSSQGIIACINYPADETSDNYLMEKILVALDNINDPGNLGTIIRTCYWFGIFNLILSRDTADYFNPKVLRSSQGAVFHMNFIIAEEMKDIVTSCAENGFKVYLFDVNAGNYISEIQSIPADKSLLVFGNESNGISENLLSDKRFTKLKIQGFSECESLNVAVSVGIVINDFSIRLMKP
ncbi:MAG: RNA methyltransferase [Bacteroidetes bacterium]|nr:RNA methyltransferase [Bacteroidota bacterium]